MEKISQLIKIALLTLLLVSCNHSYSPEEVYLHNDSLYLLNSHKPLTGFVRSYDENNQLKWVKTYHNGIPHGYYLRFYPNKQLSLKMYYSNGKPLTFTQYYHSGTIKAKQYDSAGYQWIIRYNEKGMVIEKQQLKNSLLEGNVYQYYDNGLLKALIRYKEGKKDGIFKTFFSNGKLQSIGRFENDTLHGILKSWTKEGMFAEECYRKGKRVGTWKYYYPNGKIKTIISFTDKGTVKERIDYDTLGTIMDKFSFIN